MERIVSWERQPFRRLVRLRLTTVLVVEVGFLAAAWILGEADDVATE